MIYETDNYIIVKGRKGYDIRHKYSKRHSHNIHSLKIAKKIIHNIEANIKPHTKNKYLLHTYYRLATDKAYLEQIIVLKSKNKQMYYNVNKGVV